MTEEIKSPEEIAREVVSEWSAGADVKISPTSLNKWRDLTWSIANAVRIERDRKLVLPEKKSIEHNFGGVPSFIGYVIGWNDLIDEIKKLNGVE